MKTISTYIDEIKSGTKTKDVPYPSAIPATEPKPLSFQELEAQRTAQKLAADAEALQIDFRRITDGILASVPLKSQTQELKRVVAEFGNRIDAMAASNPEQAATKSLSDLVGDAFAEQRGETKVKARLIPREKGLTGILFPSKTRTKEAQPMRLMTQGEALIFGVTHPTEFLKQKQETQRSTALRGALVNDLAKLTAQFQREAAAQIRSGQAFDGMGTFSRMVDKFSDSAKALIGQR